MGATKADILARLQREILPLQGFKHSSGTYAVEMGLGPVRHAFPQARFPIGAIHEFLCDSPECLSATGGFISGLLSSLMRGNAAAVWIGATKNIYAPALKQFGIEPDRIIFIQVQKERDLLWCVEEALKCDGLATVIAELRDLDFKVSRRFQLAVEQSRVTGFIIRTKQGPSGATASIARWRISSLPSSSGDSLPGVGFPRWNVELLKVRNGKPGTWQIEWNGRRFRHPAPARQTLQEPNKKTG